MCIFYVYLRYISCNNNNNNDDDDDGGDNNNNNNNNISVFNEDKSALING